MTEVAGALARGADVVQACRKCPLGFQRTQAVFGAGSETADLMFIGEAPGATEDQVGEPFVGRAGKLLTSLIESEIGLTREQVYIANVLKCRPPENRDPLPEEIEACSPYLRRQIELVDPRIVVTLGNFASKLLLGTTTGITRLRGQTYEFGNRKLMPTFHPSAALRGGSAMSGIKEDFRLLARLLSQTPN